MPPRDRDTLWRLRGQRVAGGRFKKVEYIQFLQECLDFFVAMLNDPDFFGCDKAPKDP
jgi:hypothetical protein